MAEQNKKPIVAIRNVLAFTAGVIWTSQTGLDYAQYPLSSVFHASISGLGAVFGADLVGNIMPPLTNVMVIGTLSASCVYYGSKLLNK